MQGYLDHQIMKDKTVEPGQIQHGRMPAAALMQPDEQGGWYDVVFEPRFTDGASMETKQQELVNVFEKLAGKPYLLD